MLNRLVGADMRWLSKAARLNWLGSVLRPPPRHLPFPLRHPAPTTSSSWRAASGSPPSRLRALRVVL